MERNDMYRYLLIFTHFNWVSQIEFQFVRIWCVRACVFFSLCQPNYKDDGNSSKLNAKKNRNKIQTVIRIRRRFSIYKVNKIETTSKQRVKKERTNNAYFSCGKSRPEKKPTEITIEHRDSRQNAKQWCDWKQRKIQTAFKFSIQTATATSMAAHADRWHRFTIVFRHWHCIYSGWHCAAVLFK